MRRGVVQTALITALFTLVMQGCSDSSGGSEDCKTSKDCELGMVCLRGECQDSSSANNPNSTNNSVGNNAVNNSSANNSSGPSCADGAAITPGALVLNEIFAAVPTGEAGDANGDGVRDADQDEFLEFVNVSGTRLSVGGLKVYKGDGANPALTVQTACLDPGQALVVFGGLQEGATPPSYAGAVVEISPKSLGLTNGGARLRVETAGGASLYDFTYPGVSDASATLSPQLSDGTNYVKHTELASGIAFSPGTCPDGSALSSGCGAAPNNSVNNNSPQGCPDAPEPTASNVGERIMINEVLANVPNDPVTGDVNMDGVRDAAEDEFIELVNISGETLRVGGMEIRKDDSVKATVGLACLPPGGSLVIFGGGTPPERMGEAYVEKARSTFGFSNSGGSRISLHTAGGELISTLTLPSSGAVSLNRFIELLETADLVPHTDLAPGRLYSPGTCANGALLSEGCPSIPVESDGDAGMDMDGGMDTGPDMDGGDMMDAEPDVPACEGVVPTGAQLVLNEVLGDVPNNATGDTNGDGVRDAAQDEFVELFNVSNQTLRVEGITVRKDDTVKATLRGCLEPNSGLIIFGGIQNGATPATFPGMTSLVATSTFQFANGGDTVKVIGAGGEVLADYTYGGTSSGRSWVRQPELDSAGTFTRHEAAAGATGPFSPGVCANGMPLTTGCQ